MSVACQGREWEEPLVEQREVGMRMEKPEGRSTAVLEHSREHSRLFGRGREQAMGVTGGRAESVPGWVTCSYRPCLSHPVAQAPNQAIILDSSVTPYRTTGVGLKPATSPHLVPPAQALASPVTAGLLADLPAPLPGQHLLTMEIRAHLSFPVSLNPPENPCCI